MTSSHNKRTGEPQFYNNLTLFCLYAVCSVIYIQTQVYAFPQFCMSALLYRVIVDVFLSLDGIQHPTVHTLLEKKKHLVKEIQSQNERKIYKALNFK